MVQFELDMNRCSMRESVVKSVMALNSTDRLRFKMLTEVLYELSCFYLFIFCRLDHL